MEFSDAASESQIDARRGAAEDDSGGEEPLAGPADRDVIPADVVSLDTVDEVLFVVGTQGGKVTRIAGLEGLSQLKV
jgi:hypothetical protein